MRLDLRPVRIVAGMIFWLAAVTAALTQDSTSTPDKKQAPERSVTILPNGPGADAPKTDPSIAPVRLELLNSNIKAENAAGVSLDLIPNGEVIAGSKVGFRITTKKQGYLIVLDVNANGKLTQIFPTPEARRSARYLSNLIKPGRPLTLPQLGSPYAAFEFVAEAPAGIAVVVALLSDRPVQVVDLPDAPPPSFAPNDTLAYIFDKARTLMISSENGNGLERPKWSFDGKFYLIK
jgi:Domain of unknown function (DUF4384)